MVTVAASANTSYSLAAATTQTDLRLGQTRGIRQAHSQPQLREDARNVNTWLAGLSMGAAALIGIIGWCWLMCWCYV